VASANLWSKFWTKRGRFTYLNLKPTIYEPDEFNLFRAKYETFNVMDDEDVDDGLKFYSKHATYPQVYVDGQLIGGLDSIRVPIYTFSFSKASACVYQCLF